MPALSTQNLVLMALILISALAAIAFSFIAIKQSRRALYRRIEQSKPTTNRNHHKLSPVFNHESEIGPTRFRSKLNERIRVCLAKYGIARPSFTNFVLLSVLISMFVAISLTIGATIYFSILLSVFAAFSILIYIERKRLSRRIKVAKNQFPTALSLIVRTLKTGLTLQDALQLVATEGPIPLRFEFTRILNDQSVGISLPDACQRMAERLPFDTAEFFALIIGIQNEAGGSIVSALENLAETNEERMALSDKITIAGQEARASAAIIGSLPFLVLGLLWLVQPNFVNVLFQTPKGQVALGIAFTSILLGSFIMQEMAKFDE